MTFHVLSESFFRNIEGHRLYASFSGGADSTALVLALFQAKIPFTAVHFNHGIRDAETGWQEYDFCRKFCAMRMVPFLYRKLNVPEHILAGEGMEEAARRCRMDAWQDILKDIPDAAILTAHHKDDVRENLLIRLFRGGNVSSLTGLREKNRIGSLLFLRPLLGCSKNELKVYLRENGITLWMEDATNRENLYTRNFFRNQILPEICQTLPFASGGLDAAVDALNDDADFLDLYSGKIYQENSALLEQTDFWRHLPPAIMIRVLRRLLQEHLPVPIVPDRAFFLRFASLLMGDLTMQEKKLAVPGCQVQFLVNKKNIVLKNTDIACLEPIRWDYRKTPEIRFGVYSFQTSITNRMPDKVQDNESFWDARILPAVLTLSVKKDGDTIIPFGHSSPVKIKKIFCDHHIPESIRSNLPMLRDGDTILWVPGVKRSAAAPCSDETDTVLRICIKKELPPIR